MQIRLLGPLEVRADHDTPVDVPGARLRALLAALALEAGRQVPHAALVDRVWGEDPPAEAANALQRLVSRLRKVLPDGWVEAVAGGYRLTVPPDAVDALRFERLVGEAREADDRRRVPLLRDALGLWQGAALQDVGRQPGGALDATATRLEAMRLAATEDLFEAEVRLGHGARLVPDLTDAVAEHPVRERLVAALMRALAAAGRDSEALLVYERARSALAEALGVDPSPELSALHTALLRGELAPREARRGGGIPAELTRFLGRDADVAAVRGLITEHRLTTLVGPGGSGKTRLATETARGMAEELPDEVWLVELAAVGADGDVAQTTLTALGLRDSVLGAGAPDAGPLDRLVATIRERDALLILDNCEHVIEQAAELAHRVLRECPRLRILATSREPLGITGEALWVVEPLALPREGADATEIESSPAVRLLRERAGAVRRDLGEGPRTSSTLAGICRALDGMPLAIELAAARLRTMTLDQLATGLDDRFRLLTGGSRTALPRHKTLRAVVDWSWDLLTDTERAVLRRLSVFAGGASVRGAERVCSGDGVAPERVLDALTSLTEKSLLFTDATVAPRYRMLGTIKEYAAARLGEAGETRAVRRAHLDHVTELAEEAEPHLRRAEQLDWLRVLDAEHDDLAAAMRAAIADGDVQAAMRLAAAAGYYWWLGGHRVEGRELVSAATRMPGEATDDLRAIVSGLMVLFVSGGRGDEHTAEKWIREAYRFGRRGQTRFPILKLVTPLERLLHAPDEALSAFESLLDDSDPWLRALARVHHGKLMMLLGHDGRGPEAELERGFEEFRRLGDRFGMWFALTTLADRVAMRGELVAACELYERAVVVASELGGADDVIRMRSRQAQLYWLAGDRDAGAAAMAKAERSAEPVTWPDALFELALAKAEIARWEGDVEQARRHLERATAVLGDDADEPGIRVLVHDLLGYLADDLDEARAHRAQAWRAVSALGHPVTLAQVLVGFADLALRRDRPEQAASLLGASAAVGGLPDLSQPDPARVERAARRALGDARFDEAAREGAAASPAELVEAALTR